MNGEIAITLSAAEAKAIIEARRELSYNDADLGDAVKKIKAAQAAAAEQMLVAAVATQRPMLLAGEGHV